MATPSARGAAPAKRIAAVVTEYRENSHADVIVTKFLEGCKILDVDFVPQVEVASLYLDQRPLNDIGEEMAARHHVRLSGTIEEALTLGTDRLAVDGVLLIGEHGRYPYNEIGQHLYPRRRFFDATAEVMRGSGRSVPLFNDKHLAFAWADAKHIYDTARELKIPLMAGSSLPVTWRKPDLRIAPGTELAEALVVGYGPTEAYGFHALETLQCMAERRAGFETGVAAVRHVSGDAIWSAAEAGDWSRELLRAALARSEKEAVRAASVADARAKAVMPEAFLIEYRDGFRGTVLLLPDFVEEFLFAARVKGRSEPVSTLFWLQDGRPFAHFARLCVQIQKLFLTGIPPYPVERTLLTTGILDAVMHSRAEKGARRLTPELAISYRPEAVEK